MLVMVGTFVGVTTMIFAGLAAWFAWKAPTKGDLGRVEAHAAATSEKLADVQTHLSDIKNDIKRVEANTSETSKHLESVRSGIASVDTQLKKQDEVDKLKILANRVPISALGYQSGNVPLDILLTVIGPQEPSFAINHLELYNESDLLFGSFACAKIGSLQELRYRAPIPMKTIGDWFRSGVPIGLERIRRLKIRVWMRVSGVEVPRDMAAIITQSDGSGYPAFEVRANI